MERHEREVDWSLQGRGRGKRKRERELGREEEEKAERRRRRRKQRDGGGGESRETEEEEDLTSEGVEPESFGLVMGEALKMALSSKRSVLELLLAVVAVIFSEWHLLSFFCFFFLLFFLQIKQQKATIHLLYPWIYGSMNHFFSDPYR